MLVCLACPKSANPHHLPTHHAQEDDDDLLSNKHPSSTGSRSEPIKSFTTQLKDIVLKFSSGAYRHCRPCTAAQGSDAHDPHNSHRQENDEEEEERSSILRSLTSEPSSEAQSPTYGQFGTNSSSTAAGRYDLLPVQHHKHHRRHHHHHHHNRRHHHDLHRPRSRRHDSNSSASTPARPSSSSSSLNAHIEHQLRLMQQQQYQMQDTSSASPSRRPSSGRTSWDRRMMQDGSGRSSMCLNNGSRSNSNVQKLLADDGQASEEWVAQVEPGVMITLVALPDGSNQLKRIRFSQELFNKWQAQLWWAENSDMVYELYSITKNEAPCGSPSSSCSTSSRLEDALRNTPEMLSRANSALNSPVRISDHNIGISFPTTLTPSALNGGLFSPSSSSHRMDHHLDHHDHHSKVHGGDGHDHHHDRCNTKLDSAPLILSHDLTTIVPFTFPRAILSSSSSSSSSHHHKANVERHHLMEDPSPCHDIVEHHHLAPSLFVKDPSSCDDIVDPNHHNHHHLTSSSYMKDQDPSYCDETTNALPQELTSSTITTTSASPHDGLSPTPSNTCELLEGASGAGKEGDDDEEEEAEDDDGGDENEALVSASSGAAGGVRELKRVRLNKQPPN